MQQDAIANRLGEVRKHRGVGATELARRVGVSRQTIHAIESGAYVPNTAVALRLARELDVPVHELFALRESAAEPETVTADVLSADPPGAGQPVRVCQIGSRWVSVPVSASPYYLPEADGVVRQARRGRADLAMISSEAAVGRRLVLAGCDPATGLLAHTVERSSGVELVCAGASSRLALRWLKEGKVHIAGSHLEDPVTGEFNLPFLRREFPHDEFTVVTFARWEEGLVIAPGNPKGIRGVEDIARADVRFVNREAGSGSRALLDRLLEQCGARSESVRGYDRVAHGHLEAAYAVLSRDVDACLATRSAAKTFGLDFVPVRAERYDLVMRKGAADLPVVQSFLDALQRASLRRKLEVLAGYDTSEMGAVIA